MNSEPDRVIWIYGDGNMGRVWDALTPSATSAAWDVLTPPAPSALYVDKTRPSRSAGDLYQFVQADLDWGVPASAYPTDVVVGYNGGAMAWIFPALQGIAVPQCFADADLAGLRFAAQRFSAIGARVHLIDGPGVPRSVEGWASGGETAALAHIRGVTHAIASSEFVTVIDVLVNRSRDYNFDPDPRDPHISREEGARFVAQRLEDRFS